MSLAMASALTFRPVLPTKKDGESSLLNRDNWRNPKYVVWVLAIFFGLFGYLVRDIDDPLGSNICLHYCLMMFS